MELGGYIELDNYTGNMLHEEGVLLNSGRACLAYILLAKKVNTIYLPWFCCSDVRDYVKKIGVNIRQYNIDEHWLPRDVVLDDGDYLYVVNYYGQLTDEQIINLKNKYSRIILDNAQAYFAKPLPHVDTLYTCRKFFGVPDGGVLFTDSNMNRELPLDESCNRMHFLLGRYERTASEFYSEYAANNDMFADEDIKRMSKLTRNLLHGLDYDGICEKRTLNFNYLHRNLGPLNKLVLKSIQGGYSYPLLLENGASIRKRLIENKVYVPCLWPNVLEDLPEDTYEYNLAANILPLPIDQRYGVDEMNYLIGKIQELLDE